jgi:hypothetical protein
MDQLDQENGFISEPSIECMAEFMTAVPALAALPHMNDSYETASSITGGTGPTVMSRAAAVQHQLSQLPHNQHNQLNTNITKGTQCAPCAPTPIGAVGTVGTVDGIGPHSLSVSSTSQESPKSGANCGDFAWMREKKTTRKQQHSGETYRHSSFLTPIHHPNTQHTRPIPTRICLITLITQKFLNLHKLEMYCHRTGISI